MNRHGGLLSIHKPPCLLLYDRMLVACKQKTYVR